MIATLAVVVSGHGIRSNQLTEEDIQKLKPILGEPFAYEYEPPSEYLRIGDVDSSPIPEGNDDRIKDIINLYDNSLQRSDFLVHLLINEKGSLDKVTITEGDFVKPKKKLEGIFMKTWKFHPAIKDRVPVKTHVMIHVPVPVDRLLEIVEGQNKTRQPTPPRRPESDL